MADITFEEGCPCGATIKVQGYVSAGVRDHINSWHKLHNKHSNSIAKAVAEDRRFPAYCLHPAPPSGHESSTDAGTKAAG